jgi:AcrR family transcriptional regulator
MPRRQEVSREQVLRVASRLFYQRGVHVTGLAEVIAAAGCGKQALYRLFPSKDDLVAAYLEQMATEHERAVERVIAAAGDDPSAQLIAMTAEVAALAGRAGFYGCALRNYLHEHPNQVTKASAVAERRLRRARDRVHRLARAARPEQARALAQQVWVVHEGLWGNPRAGRQELAAALDLVAELVRSRIE